MATSAPPGATTVSTAATGTSRWASRFLAQCDPMRPSSQRHANLGRWTSSGLAPARQTGYVQSFESNPASPNIWRPRMEGAPYLMVIRLSAIVAEALAGGLAKSNLTMPIRALKNLGILISEYYTSRTQHVTMARPKGRGQLEDKRATRRSAPPTRTRSPFEEINLVPGAATGNVIDASFGTLGRVGTNTSGDSERICGSGVWGARGASPT